MRLSRVLSFVAVACFVMTTAARAQESENPAYKSWAAHKPGTMVKHKSVTDAAGQKMEGEMVWTLLEVTPEKAVIEMKTTMTVMGNKMEQPATKQEIPAKLATGQSGNPADEMKKQGAEVKESEETVTVNGKEIKAKVYDVKMKQGEMDVTSKMWISNDVPGMLVRNETKTSGQMASDTKMELVEWELK